MNKIEAIDYTVEVVIADDVIADLRKRLTGLTANTHRDYAVVKVGIAEVSKWRTGVETARKKLVEPHVKSQREINAVAKFAKESLLEIETPLRAEIARVDEEAERKLALKEEAERLYIAAREQKEREQREAEEEAKREVERKKLEAEDARLAEARKEIDADRRRLEDDKSDWERKTRIAREAREAVKREEQERTERDEQAEAERVRLAEEEVEAERLAELCKPDILKLQEYGLLIEGLQPPEMKTDWGRTRLRWIEDILRNAAITAATSADSLVAEDAAETVSEHKDGS